MSEIIPYRLQKKNISQKGQRKVTVYYFIPFPGTETELNTTPNFSFYSLTCESISLCALANSNKNIASVSTVTLF